MDKLTFKEWSILSDLETIAPLGEDFEFSMARGELKTAKTAINRLMRHLKGEGDLEAWVQSKITKASEYLDTVADHMDGGEDDTEKKKEIEEMISTTMDGRRYKNVDNKEDQSRFEKEKEKEKESKRKEAKERKKELAYERQTKGIRFYDKKGSGYIKDGEKMYDESAKLDEKCWDGYKQLGMKKKGKKTVPNCVKEDSIDENKSGDSSLRDWFTKSRASDGTPGWVQLGGKYAGKPCAKQPGQTTKPKCGSSKMKAELSDKEEERAFRRKNQEDPNPDRKGKAKNVATEEFSNWRDELVIDEGLASLVRAGARHLLKNKALQKTVSKSLSKGAKVAAKKPAPAKLKFKTLYHGTTKKSSDAISKGGWRTDTNVTRQMAGSNVYTSNDPRVGVSYSQSRAAARGDDPALRSFRVPNTVYKQQTSGVRGGAGDYSGRGYKMTTLTPQQANKYDITGKTPPKLDLSGSDFTGKMKKEVNRRVKSGLKRKQNVDQLKNDLKKGQEASKLHKAQLKREKELKAKLKREIEDDPYAAYERGGNSVADRKATQAQDRSQRGPSQKPMKSIVADPKKLRPGESYYDYAKRQGMTTTTASKPKKERKRDKIGMALSNFIDRIGGLNKEEVEIHEEGGKKDACYSKVKSRYSVWPSAYASGALVKCRKVGAKNWGNKTKKEGYEFSNWRDEFKATEYETVDIIETTPLKETEEIRYCPKCKKNEKKRECKYGEKYWKMFSLPASLGGGGAYDPNEVHPANEGLSFEIGGGHKKAQKMGKIRNLSKGATGGEKDAAQAALKRLGGGVSLPLADQVIYPGQLKTEDYQKLQSTGNVFSIMLMWRGKTYRLQLFFSGSKRPSREEVKSEIQKFYPGGVLTHYYPSPSDPSQPIVVIQR